MRMMRRKKKAFSREARSTDRQESLERPECKERQRVFDRAADKEKDKIRIEARRPIRFRVARAMMTPRKTAMSKTRETQELEIQKRGEKA